MILYHKNILLSVEFSDNSASVCANFFRECVIVAAFFFFFFLNRQLYRKLVVWNRKIFKIAKQPNCALVGNVKTDDGKQTFSVACWENWFRWAGEKVLTYRHEIRSLKFNSNWLSLMNPIQRETLRYLSLYIVALTSRKMSKRKCLLRLFYLIAWCLVFSN